VISKLLPSNGRIIQIHVKQKKIESTQAKIPPLLLLMSSQHSQLDTKDSTAPPPLKQDKGHHHLQGPIAIGLDQLPLQSINRRSRRCQQDALLILLLLLPLSLFHCNCNCRMSTKSSFLYWMCDCSYCTL
jgi:hypothetical protein